MKKFGYFLFIFVPPLLAFFIQFAASFYGMFLALILTIAQGKNPLTLFMDMSLFYDSDFNGILMIIYALVSICIFGLWYYFRYEGDYLPFVHNKFNGRKIISLIGIIILVPGAQFAANFICSGISLISPKTFEAYEELLETAGLDEKMTLILFVYSVILAPICEELIFRGVTLSCAKRIMGFWPANLIQAALFGLFHMNWVQGIYAFALGALLGYICEKGKSIYFSLFLHFLFNLWAATMTLILNVEEAAWLDYAIIPITIVSLVVGIILFKLGLRTPIQKELQIQDNLLSS